MKLTDADKQHIERAWDQLTRGPGLTDVTFFLAGKRAGREDMRERAARACEGEHVIAAGTGDPARYAYNSATEHCAAAIRSLGVDDD